MSQARDAKGRIAIAPYFDNPLPDELIDDFER